MPVRTKKIVKATSPKATVLMKRNGLGSGATGRPW